MTTTTGECAGSIKILESFQSRDGASSVDGETEINYTWRLQGSNDVSAMGTVLESIRPNHVIDPVWSQYLIPVRLSWSQVGYLTYDFTITYGNAQFAEAARQLQSGESRFGFTTSGYTERITQSITTVGAWNYVSWRPELGQSMPVALAAPDFAPDMYNNVIDFDLEGNVNGVDVIRRQCDFYIEYQVPRENLTLPYTNLLGEMTGSVNSTPFYSREAGEVLFRGADAAAERSVNSVGEFIVGAESQGVRYNFSWRPNVYNIEIEQRIIFEGIGDEPDIPTDSVLVIPGKLGWEYLWFGYFDVSHVAFNLPPFIDAVPLQQAPITLRVLETAQVEQIYPYLPFTALDIGG